jgi:hypothetical protein
MLRPSAGRHAVVRVGSPSPGPFFWIGLLGLRANVIWAWAIETICIGSRFLRGFVI